MKKYWQSLEELKYTGEKPVKEEDYNKNAIIDLLEGETTKAQTSRRDFLKVLGFSFTAGTILASCERPVQKAIPYLIKPEEVTPGKANYYASSYFDGQDYGSVLVKVRDGRPIKIEGNDLSPITRGATNARIQASVLSLYDSARYAGPMIRKELVNWEKVDEEIGKKLGSIANKGQKIVLLSSTIISPSSKKAISEFLEKFPGSEWMEYDAVSFSGMLEANEKTFGKQTIPSYDFENADLVVSFGADFLGTWLSSIEYTKQYAKRRKMEKGNSLNRHIQIEGHLSLTGTNADSRIVINPSEEKAVLSALYAEISRRASTPVTYSRTETSFDVQMLADELWDARGKSLVVSGSNDTETQILVNGINHWLGNYGTTIHLNRPLYIRNGLDKNMSGLIKDIKESKVGAVLFENANPVYNYPSFKEVMDKIPLKISFSCFPDETAEKCDYICPGPHYLEAWNDAEPKAGIYSLAQPTIPPIFNSRPFQESLLAWTGVKTDYHTYLTSFWENSVYPEAGVSESFKSFWVKILQAGVWEKEYKEQTRPEMSLEPVQQVLAKKETVEQGKFRVFLYESIAIGNGYYANNPWLQELPDPISKVTWDNYAAVSPKLAEAHGWSNGDIISVDGVEVPVLLQPGQDYYTLSIALGYGRTVSGKVGNNLGVNVYPFVKNGIGNRKYLKDIASIDSTGKREELALTQTHHSMEGREIVRETTLEEYEQNPYAGNELHLHAEKHHTTLYEEPHFEAYHWGLAIDLNSCTGCNNCVIACQAENNIAVVGKDQVRRRRIMHWLRIDRYYSDAVENPSVSHQPVMCQHCDNAPCENVCPVSATMHSDEGLNQVAYNRCIGTKYCINNCPYRVRRFNWYEYVNNQEFDYHQNSPLGKMVLNPDVTVRERGVIEKCTFCVQRIQEKKLLAKSENRALRDGEVQTACVQSCPSNALVFGDMNDKNSKVSQLMKTERNYHLLEELHTLPSVGYLTKVRNVKPVKS